MLTLKSKPTLQDLQKYIEEIEKERGFDDETVLEKSLLLGEEIGELYKAIRKESKMHIDPNSKVGAIDEEIADIMIYVLAIANIYNIDVEKAIRDKEEKNNKRTWTK